MLHPALGQQQADQLLAGHVLGHNDCLVLDVRSQALGVHLDGDTHLGHLLGRRQGRRKGVLLLYTGSHRRSGQGRDLGNLDYRHSGWLDNRVGGWFDMSDRGQVTLVSLIVGILLDHHGLTVVTIVTEHITDIVTKPDTGSHSHPGTGLLQLLHPLALLLVVVHAPPAVDTVQAGGGRLEPATLDQHRTASVRVLLNPRVGGQEGACPASQQPWSLARRTFYNGGGLGQLEWVGEE